MIDPVCNTDEIDLSMLAASITGVADGTWSSSGDGSFTGGTNFTTATAYVPGAGDITAGTVTLTLTSDDPAGPCTPVADNVQIDIITCCDGFDIPTIADIEICGSGNTELAQAEEDLAL
ncbi:MAG: hypothetical protein H6554_04045 [Chitinophagales bacterium]|nr:hypothetical protein [Chitinophagales bacterium]